MTKEEIKNTYFELAEDFFTKHPAARIVNVSYIRDKDNGDISVSLFSIRTCERIDEEHCKSTYYETFREEKPFKPNTEWAIEDKLPIQHKEVIVELFDGSHRVETFFDNEFYFEGEVEKEKVVSWRYLNDELSSMSESA